MDKWNTEYFRRYFGSILPLVSVPDLVDYKPVLEDTEATFGLRSQQLDDGLDEDLSVSVTIDAYDVRKVCVYNSVERYEVPYKVYASNPDTGKKCEFSGTLYSKSYRDFLILKEEVDESEYE